MGGRSGQGINSGLTNYANTYAKSIGLNKKDFNIVLIDSSNNVAGGIEFNRIGNSDVFKVDKNVMIDKSLSQTEKQKAIRHELTHVKQSKDGRLYINGSEGRAGGFYWEGKRYMSLSNYNKIMIDLNSPSASRRARAFSKYVNLPWEKEAFSNE